MNIFKLVGEIFVDTDEANSSIQKTGETAESTGSKLGSFASGAAKVGTAVVGAAAAVGTSVYSMASESASAMDVIDKASQRMGVSAESYQELSHAASLSGVEMSTLETAAKTLEKNFEDISFDEAMEQIYALETAEERSALAAELFGEKAAYSMSPMLNASAEDMAAMKEEAHELGLVFDETAVKDGAALNDALSNVQDAITSLGTGLGNSLMPVVKEVCDLIIDYLPQIQGLFDMLAPILSDVFENIMPPLFDIVESIMPVLMQVLPPLLELLSPLLNLLIEILDPLLKLINLILPPLIEVITFIVEKVLAQVIKQIQSLKASFKEGWETIKSVCNAAKSFFIQFKTSIGNIFNQIRDAVKRPINAIIGFINGMISGVVSGVNGIIGALNKLKINVPSWVTKLTGVTSFGFNLAKVSAPQIPLLAKGGELEGSAIVGEDGPELLQTNGAKTRVTPLNDNNNAFVELSQKMDELLSILQNGFGVMLDGNAMVGQLAPAMDKRLGYLATKNGRMV